MKSEYDCDSFGHAMHAQFKLVKHLNKNDISRIRDYMAHIIGAWPDLNKCPVERTLLRRSMTILNRNGIFLNKGWTIRNGIEDVFI